MRHGKLRTHKDKSSRKPEKRALPVIQTEDADNEAVNNAENGNVKHDFNGPERRLDTTLQQSYKHPSRLDHLDGIRALALLGVLLYHFELLGCRGGYTGVDVFFVLSGFLMTRNICNAIWQDAFSLKTFYLSRFWRLYPSSVVTVVLILVAGRLIMSESLYRELCKSAISTLFMFSNILFGSQIGGYFDGGAITKPLLHTWSLSVEEQFYACYPVFLVLFAGKARLFNFAISIMTLVSFLLAITFVEKFQTWTWYLLPTRIYEFLIGAIAFVVYEGIPESVWWHEGVSVAGLVGVAVSYWFMSDATTFPGWASLPSTLGAAFMILSPHSSLSNWILSSYMAKWVGKVSYAAYLVHWPLWVMVVYVTGSHGYGFGCLLASGAMGWLQFTYFETPVREHRPKPVVLLWILAILLITAPQTTFQPAAFVGIAAFRDLPDITSNMNMKSVGPARPAGLDILSVGSAPSTMTSNESALESVLTAGPMLQVPSFALSKNRDPSASSQPVLVQIPVSKPIDTVIPILVPVAVPAAESSLADRYYTMHPIPPAQPRPFMSFGRLVDNYKVFDGDISWYNGNLSRIAHSLCYYGHHAWTFGRNITRDRVPDLITAGDSYFGNIQDPIRLLSQVTNISVLSMVHVGALGLGYTEQEIVEMATWRGDKRGTNVPPSYALNEVFESINQPTVWLMAFRYHYTPLAHYQWGSERHAVRFEIEFPKMIELFKSKNHQLIIASLPPAPYESPAECVQRLGKLGGPTECPYWDVEAEEIVYYNHAIKRLVEPYLNSTVVLIDSESLLCRSDELNETSIKCRVRAQDNGEPLYFDGRNGHLNSRGSLIYMEHLEKSFETARQRLEMQRS